MKKLKILNLHLQMKLLKECAVSLTGMLGVESFEYVENITELVKFAGQSVIGTLTIIYIVLKIKNLLNEKDSNY